MKPYPSTLTERNKWVLSHRGPKNRLDPFRPYASLWEEEVGEDDRLIPTATLFLTNKECPYRCLMCDLWQNTLDERVAVGAIPEQITHALSQLPAARQIKLYNAGSFFDPQAIPPEDYPAIARLCANFERVVVECHPALIGDRTLAFRNLLPSSTTLEVALGLETVHPGVLEKLNKRITVESFRRAAGFLIENRMALRVFLLLRPPFLSEAEGLEWACRSLDVSCAAGATAITLIPTRAGNGAMEVLASMNDYAPPSLRSLEAAQEYGLGLHQGRVFSDLWDSEKFHDCYCSAERVSRLEIMNKTQRIPDATVCKFCSE